MHGYADTVARPRERGFLDDRNAADVIFSHRAFDLPDGSRRRQRDRIENDAVLAALDLLDFAIARADSVTVSIGAETSGIFSSMDRVSRVCGSASAGTKSLREGMSRTSSKVIPSFKILECSMCEEYRKEACDVK
jgi:hypothetical protein